MTTPTFINSNSPTLPTPLNRPEISNPPPDSYSNTSSDEDYSLRNTEERHRNLLFGDLLTSQRDKDHTRLIFQNVNSLDLSSSHRTLELICDSIEQYEVVIAYLADTNTNWKHPYDAASFKVTKKYIGVSSILVISIIELAIWKLIKSVLKKYI